MAFRMSRAQLDAEIRGRAGCVALRYAQRTKTLVGLYRSAEAGMEEDPDYPWSTVCEDHGSIVCHHVRADAEAALPRPDDWCDECREKSGTNGDPAVI